MPIRLKYIGFNQGNPDFPKTNIITRFFIENDIIVNDIQDANVLLIGDFVNGTDINTIKQFNGIKIQYIAEPILYLKYCILSKMLFIHNICEYKLGCVSTKSKYIHLRTFKFAQNIINRYKYLFII
jgi:adenine-specific DNA methylase